MPEFSSASATSWSGSGPGQGLPSGETDGYSRRLGDPWGLRILEYDTGFEAQNRRVLNGTGSIGLDNVLQVGLKERPFVDLDAVVNFKNGRVVRLIDISFLLQGFDIVELYELVVVAHGNQALIDEGQWCSDWYRPDR